MLELSRIRRVGDGRYSPVPIIRTKGFHKTPENTQDAVDGKGRPARRKEKPVRKDVPSVVREGSLVKVIFDCMVKIWPYKEHKTRNRESLKREHTN